MLILKVSIRVRLHLVPIILLCGCTPAGVATPVPPSALRANAQEAPAKVEAPASIERPLYAIVEFAVEGGAGLKGHDLSLKVQVKRFDALCPGRIVNLSYVWQWNEISQNSDPAVVSDSEVLCFPVSSANPPQAFLGYNLVGRPATLSVINGEEYLSPEPDDFDYQGASFFLPADRGGFQVGVFGIAGNLETPDASKPFPIVAVGISAVRLAYPLAEAHFFLSARNPDGSQFNAGLGVPVGPLVDGAPPVLRYKDTNEGYIDEP